MGCALPVLAQLGRTIEQRRDESEATASYTKKLLVQGVSAIAAKVLEEGAELAAALQNDEGDERVISESADVLYHLMVGLASRGLALRDVERELARRFNMSGLEEKASRGKS